MTFIESVRQDGICTHEDVPTTLGQMFVELLRTAPVKDASSEAKEFYEKLRGHALDASLLKFKEPEKLRSLVIGVDAPAGVSWRSFGCIVVVSPAPESTSNVAVRVDLYSLFRGAKGPVNAGDCYLRLDVARDGQVLDYDLNGIPAARTPAATAVYGTMLYFAALVISGAAVRAGS